MIIPHKFAVNIINQYQNSQVYMLGFHNTGIKDNYLLSLKSNGGKYENSIRNTC